LRRSKPGDRLISEAGRVAGTAGYIPWGRTASAVAAIAGSTLCLASQESSAFEPGANLAGEPRDRLVRIEHAAAAPLSNAVTQDVVLGIGALMRAAQMAGAMEACLGPCRAIR